MALTGDDYIHSVKTASKHADGIHFEHTVAWIILLGSTFMLTVVSGGFCILIAECFLLDYMIPGMFISFLVSFAVLHFLLDILINA
jgi:hypothetical protein